MKIFDFISGKKDKESSGNQGVPEWIPLEDIGQLQSLKEISENTPVIIFKHSTRCGISAMVKNRFERDFDFPVGELQCYFLDIIRNRDISNTIASEFGIPHESPQLLLIKKSSAIYDASHGGISVKAIHKVLD
ncbi:bacillithiol system redox-active protein YtxJ [Robertkochia solimangrovi]|uniref:bacillithiol system redox-active protein YtxJ n=1 Tax=Robertkochia solimangrovi TaxID=2213046 RepID=UPI001180D454|nr:bacillithiol system redox-active protein YtxJ [Robertkochia solimangrovi]TRZ45175.1 bacillithiol system redox-active protein YtxJ [Robertkochia solimangrovi]